MARSTQYFYDLLISEKENFSSLHELTPISDTNLHLLEDLRSNTKVAVWRLIFWIFSYGLHIIDRLFDHHKTEIETIMNSKIPGTIQWLREEIMKFQLGHQLTWINGKYQYQELDPSAQIIKYCSVIQIGNQVRIKVAKDNNGEPEPLNATEYSALLNYIEQIKFAGTNSVLISTLPDKLKLKIVVKYNPQLMNSNGELITDNSKPVEEAIKNYLKSLTYDGKLVVNALIDAIQQAKGVIDLRILEIAATYGNIPYQPIIDEYTTYAGHIIIDPSYPLNQSITYVSYV